jgi:YfiR/HmsC-like
MKQARLIAVIMMCLSLALGANAQALDSSDSSEYLIKAGFVYNFAKLVAWPATAFAQPDSPIVIGILGTDPFGTTIDRVVGDKKIDGRGFVVKRLKWGADIKDCNILFVSSSETVHLDELIHLVKGMPILTIGETPGFARRGGIINFTLEDNKVRFEVNIEAAKRADLTISSRLLTLARIVQQVAADGRKPE